jgi:hypothetical protein
MLIVTKSAWVISITIDMGDLPRVMQVVGITITALSLGTSTRLRSMKLSAISAIKSTFDIIRLILRWTDKSPLHSIRGKRYKCVQCPDVSGTVL